MSETLGDKVRAVAVALLPPAPDKCQICAGDHPPELPHNQQSLYYQVRFQREHGRWPTWTDALEHCPPAIRAAWTEELRKRGIDVE